MKKAAGATNVTLAQIAANLGVHRSTVSICLGSSERAEKFSPALRTRIQDEAQRLSYRPNFFASQLRKGEKKVVLLGIGHIRDPHAGEIAESFVQSMEAQGFQTMLTSFYEKKIQELDSLRSMLGPNSINSICMITSALDWAPKGWIDELVDEDVHVALIGRHSKRSEILQVYCDEEESGRLAARHLHECGYLQLGIVCDTLDRNHALYPRLTGFLSEAAKLQLKQPRVFEVGSPGKLIADGSQSSIASQVDVLMQLDGIFATRDVLAYAVIQNLQRRGKIIAEEVGVLGHGDLFTSQLWNPPLSTIRQPMKRMGAAAAEMLFENLSTKLAVPPRVFETVLIQRSSTRRADGPHDPYGVHPKSRTTLEER